MNRSRILALLLFLSPLSARANDYSFSTNLIQRGVLPWRIAVLLIKTSVEGLEERQVAVSCLIRYKSRGLVPYLKSYTNDPADPVRIAAFWPLYKNGEQAFAMEMLRKEIQRGNTAASSVFFKPNSPGSDYKIELTRNDAEFKRLVEEVATNRKNDPRIRIFAAIHLTQIEKGNVASIVAKEILAGITPDPNIKDYNAWPEGAKRNFHLRKWTEWCLHILRP